MKHTENLVVIHLSATAVYAVIGQVVSANDIRIMGITQVKNNDFTKGQITHRERLKGAIRQAIHEVEDKTNCRVHSVWVSISTPELVGKNSFGQVFVDKEVKIKDVVQALTLAKQKDVPNDYYLMHHCQQGIEVAGQSSVMVDDVLGMYTDKITVMYHLMMMPVASRQNLQRLLQECDVSVDHIIFDAVSGAEYGLLPEERVNGVCFIDIGASTTSVCVYRENRLIFTSCQPVGGNDVTNDIATRLDISKSEAEYVKKQYGTVDINSIDPSKFITLNSSSGGNEVTINLQDLSQIIRNRYYDIFIQTFSQVEKVGLVPYLGRGVVLSGGGSLIHGMVAFAKKNLSLPVMMTNRHDAIRVYEYDDEEKTKAIGMQIKDRVYQTAFGVLLYSQSDQFRHSENSSPEAIQKHQFQNIFEKVNYFLKKFM